jgi:hypothetical protein
MNTLLPWLPTIVTLLGAAGAWGASQSRLDALTKDLEAQRKAQEARDLATSTKLDKILDASGAHELRITRAEDRLTHETERLESLVEVTRDVLEAATRRIDALERELHLSPEPTERRRKPQT